MARVPAGRILRVPTLTDRALSPASAMTSAAVPVASPTSWLGSSERSLSPPHHSQSLRMDLGMPLAAALET
jgi:hypothetical protein